MAGALVVQLTGGATLVAGPPSACEPPASPSGTTIPLMLTPCQKSIGAQSGDQQMVLNSPNAFVALAGVGTTVQQVTTFFFKSQAPVKLRLTFEDSSVAVIPVYGNVGPIEFDPANYLTLAECQGAGSIEWFAAGPT